jgi:hypothetical protein
VMPGASRAPIVFTGAILFATASDIVTGMFTASDALLGRKKACWSLVIMISYEGHPDIGRVS